MWLSFLIIQKVNERNYSWSLGGKDFGGSLVMCGSTIIIRANQCTVVTPASSTQITYLSINFTQRTMGHKLPAMLPPQTHPCQQYSGMRVGGYVGGFMALQALFSALLCLLPNDARSPATSHPLIRPSPWNARSYVPLPSSDQSFFTSCPVPFYTFFLCCSCLNEALVNMILRTSLLVLKLHIKHER